VFQGVGVFDSPLRPLQTKMTAMGKKNQKDTKYRDDGRSSLITNLLILLR